jgi:hypothetical protein
LSGRVNHYGDRFQLRWRLRPNNPEARRYNGAEIGYRLLGKVQVYLGARKLPDEYPDLSSEDIFYFGNFPNDVLSPIGFNGRFVYGGLRASF